MGPLSLLSPIDPERNIQQVTGAIEQIAIQDVIQFIEFAKTKVGLTKKNDAVEILKSLTTKIDPKILGSINRTHALIQMLAKGLLRLHLNREKDKRRISTIVENLTEKSYSHHHFIGRKEAKESVGFGSMIEFSSPETEK